MPTRVIQTAAGVLIALVVAGALVLGTLALVHQGQASYVACHDVNGLRSALVSVLQNSEKGLPRNAYYKAHPAELHAAIAQAQQYISRLGPVAC